MSLSYNPVISIITVCYNAEKTIEATMLSVLNQTYKNIEYMIIDGKSRDNTVKVILKYQNNLGYFISEPDTGIYDAMNKALDVVTGDWVYFLGAGDIMLNVLDKVVTRLVNPNTVYYGDVYRNDLLKVFNGYFSPFQFSRDSICHQAIFYPAKAIKKYKFNTKYKVQADHHLNMLIYGDKIYNFKYFSIVICAYDGTGFSATTIDYEFLKDRLEIVKSNFSFPVYLYAFFRNKISRFIRIDRFRNSKTWK